MLAGNEQRIFPLSLPLGVVKKYACFLCNATFKTTKTRLHHMKNKHNMVPARNGKAGHPGQPFKQSTPIITPISISESALLQVEPNGPLQKVDANIDTEQICRLIESLGNVQKVNQVVILGQVPPHAPPLEVQQIAHLAAPVHLNLPRDDFMGLKLTESKSGELDLSNNACDPMEQTIILEPITPDGQLLNPPLSEAGSSILAMGAVGLNNPEPSLSSCDPMEQTIILEPITPDGQLENCFPGEAAGELRFAESVPTESEAVAQLLQQTGTGAVQSGMFADNLDQTVILELTPAVMPNEPSHTEPPHPVPLPGVVPSAELEKVPAEQTGRSDSPLPQTLQLEKRPTCSSPHTPSECYTDPKDGTESQLQKKDLDDVPPMEDRAQSPETQEKNDQDASKDECLEQVEDPPKLEEPSAKERDASQVETKQASQVPLNTMSAQELVKVRKRKPSRAYFFQEYMQELVGSIYKDDLRIKAKPAKRQRAKKAHLVVKFGPQSKEKKTKEKKTSQRRKRSQEDAMVAKTQVADLPEKKGASPKKGRKGKGKKNTRHLVSAPKKKSSSPSHDSPVRQIKDARKTKMKRRKEVGAEGATQPGEQAAVDAPAFKKAKKAKIMRKVQPKVAKEGKRKKKRAEEPEKRSPASADVAQDALLLLKGHKQPQLRVYKLDTSRASAHACEAAAPPPQTSPPGNTDPPPDPSTDTRNDLSAEGKKLGGRRKKSQKALSLLSSLKVPRQQPETLPSKPKTTRKRRASSRVESEGVITSSSKRALECHDCGERFGEVSSLQKHKATVHVLDSPGLTYTNGNIFEGVTSSDFYHLPKQDRMVIGVMNTATGWDTEPELAETPSEDREPGVSFPALIPSPSLPVLPSDGMMNEDKGTSALGATVPSASDRSRESHQSSENKEPTTAVIRQEKVEDAHGAADEDIKADLLLEVDLVTVGGPPEKDELSPLAAPVGQTGSNETCERKSESAAVVEDGSEKSVSLQTCSAHHLEVKEEEEESISVQKKNKVARNRELDRGALEGGGRRRQSAAASKAGGAVCRRKRKRRSEEEEQECQVVYEQHTISSDSEVNDGSKAGVKNSELGNAAEIEALESLASLPPVSSTLEEPPEEPGTTGAEETVKVGEDPSGQRSPAVILEKFPTSGPASAVRDRSLITAKNKQGEVS